MLFDAPATTCAILAVLAVITAFIIIGYEGFVLVGSKGLPAWNCGVIPALYPASALFGGTGVVVAASFLAGEIDVSEMLLLPMLVLGIVQMFMLVAYCICLGLDNVENGRALNRLNRGQFAFFYWGFLFIVGTIVPSVILAFACAGITLPWMLPLAGILAAVATFAMRPFFLYFGGHENRL